MNYKKLQIYILYVSTKKKNVKIVIDNVYRKKIMKVNVVVILIIFVYNYVIIKNVENKIVYVENNLDIKIINIIVQNLIIIVKNIVKYKVVKINVKEDLIIKKRIIIVKNNMNVNKIVVQMDVKKSVIKIWKMRIIYINVKIINVHFNVNFVKNNVYFKIIFMISL